MRALWIAVRTLEERARVLAGMELATRSAGSDLSALRFAERREELMEAAHAVRRILAEADPEDEAADLAR